eukprot:CAMPEP_0119116738 /NCGR_PEP_ID=MMETSP1180-20130426/52453_1 /TAXON_ID=3052 ORGANISM="Chlamydomonas cf sp, Strain CCMP681" /NCGR_SAMPLE_ID=MMETSP1180 /ASSEMBLY_ACC=CAM_ASM_000741 /LENGTH=66 /DNA_ID=CAMNT_0007105923 /DNA_START=1256 /DNA_END=1456 /DNA_ORIENTATION=+
MGTLPDWCFARMVVLSFSREAALASALLPAWYFIRLWPIFSPLAALQRDTVREGIMAIPCLSKQTV